MSGYCRSITLAIVLIVLLCVCVSVAGAASLDISPVYKTTLTYQIATTAPPLATCPAGYVCLSDANAKARYGTFTRYSDAVCGYEQNTATLAAVVQVPQYCVHQSQPQNPTVCDAGCTCMAESAAKEKFGVYTRCSETPCYSAVTGAAQVNAYCFRQGTVTTTPIPATCPEGCSCISEATAKAKGGTWSRCLQDICGYEQSTATVAAVVNVPKYCMKQQETPTVCPEGCSCISEADAKLKELGKCDASENPCGYQTAATAATNAAGRIPLYCYKAGITVTPTQQVCPDGCGCMNEADAKGKFGSGNYTRCSEKVCGYDQTATSANSMPRYCFKPLVTVTPTLSVCPQGCLCTTDEIAKEKGLTGCRGTRTACGYNENKQPQYCFEQVPSTTCVWDYQKNTCTGTCQQGNSCGLIASSKDASGKIDYAICGCTGQPTGQCMFDTVKQTCTGTCQSGASCAIVGKNVDEKTGAITVVCGCPQQSSCSYNYDKDACVGTCTLTGDTCQLNTIYRDPATGKVTYAECHCKGSGEVTQIPVSQPCTCNPAGGSCTGTCADGKICTITAATPDNAGKNVCSSCGCRETCVLDANNRCSGTCQQGGQCTSTVTKDDSGQEKVSCGCSGMVTQPTSPVVTRAPNIFESIGSFFSKLFGGK
jgi:hypothetical protein